MSQNEDTPPPSLLHRLWLALSRFWWRLSDAFLIGLDPKGRRVSLKGRIFDPDFYLKENPDVADYEGDFVDHFFRHGIYEGRRARFFDSNWYFKVHTDLKSARIDALSHYRQYGHAEGRSVRYFYLHSAIERFRNRNYDEWLLINEKPKDTDAADMALVIRKLDLKARFAVLCVLTGADDLEAVRAALRTVRRQAYPAFDCLIGLTAGVAAPVRDHVLELKGADTRFSMIELEDGHAAAAFNHLAGLTKANFVTALQTRDRLSPDALFWVAHALHRKIGETGIVYADEDRVDADGDRTRPNFKPDFNYEMFLSYNVAGDFTLYHRKLFEAVGGFDTAYDGDIHYDLLLRACEVAGDDAVRHVPRLLNHVRLPEAAVQNDRAAVERHITRIGKPARVTAVAEQPDYTRVRFDLPQTLPLVTIVIPTRDRADLLRVCLDSLAARTTYPNYEVIIVDNGSVEPATEALFATLDPARFRVLRDPQPFNFSALNNHAVKEARGDYICLMNNDIEIVTPDWLEDMLSFAIRPGTGCVGARLWYPDGTIQHAGVLVGFFGVAGHMHKFTPKSEFGYADRVIQHQALSAVTAAALLVKKTIYEEVGGLDETLAVAFNDVDFCLKVRDAGYRNIYTPFAEMIHHESASRGAEITPAQKRREQKEIDIIKSRYGDSMMQDPAFNPNLSLTAEDLSFAFPPRVQTLEALAESLREDD